MICRIMQIEEGVMLAPSSICIILHIIRKPNSIIIIALLFIQNISRALFLIGFCRVHGKIARYLKTMNKKQ